jgi:hypothetical protein
MSNRRTYIRATIGLFAIMAVSPVYAEDDQCMPLAKIQSMADAHTHVTPMTSGQFNFMRGFYMALPPMLQGKLPGSGAVLIEHDGDEGALVFWTKGVLACRPAPVPKALVSALKETKTGQLDADGDEL